MLVRNTSVSNFILRAVLCSLDDISNVDAVAPNGLHIGQDVILDQIIVGAERAYPSATGVLTYISFV